MPFTLSHPAAVVPLAKRGLPLSALVIGSMAPDFPYFIHFSTDSQFGHTLAGVFLFCIPAGLFALWLFHAVLKLPLLSLLPISHQERLAPVAAKFRVGSARQLVLVLTALILGAFTHVVWDSLTHASGWAVQHLPVLRLPVLQTSRGTLFLFKMLQHGSTLAGASLLISWYLNWFKQAPSLPVQMPVQVLAPFRLRLILLSAMVAFITAIVFSYLKLSTVSRSGWLQPFARNLVLAGSAVVVFELLVFSFIWHFKASQRRHAG
jgi:hypothetical protein